MRIFPVEYDHAAVVRYLRRQAMKGFQRDDSPATDRYVKACSCGVSVLPEPNSVSLIFTRDNVPGCRIGWHLSLCCVTDKRYRGYVPKEGEYWRRLIFGRYAERAVMAPLDERSTFGVQKDVRHWHLPCAWTDRHDPAVNLEDL